MPVGEVFLGAFLSVLFERLTSPELLQFATREGIRSKLNKWETKLKMIEALLNDAEEKQLTDGAVKVWLDDLQDLAYDVEDILDEFATEGLRRKLKEDYHASTSKVRNLIPPCFTGCTPTAFKFNIRMESEMDAITSQLEELCNKNLGLKEIPGRVSTAAWRRPESTCVQPEYAVWGRDEEKANILKMVLSDEPGDANFRVISIVGMGGLGKTTLARKVFNDDTVKRFSPRAWVCVSDDFDVFKISKAILESITSQSSDLKTLNEVQVELKNKVAGNKFLLALDDVWNDKYEFWEILRSPFLAGAPGSKMIVTTRNVSVALTMEQGEYYNLKHLTDEACWDIFKMHVSGNKVKNLNSFRKRVVEKCRGLPLAARTLGGLLRTKQTDDEWENILNSKIWDSSYSNGDILPVLKLSYHHLPSHLKRCFAYCAIFPKDFEFTEMNLILLWMAEGLIRQSQNNPLEDVGKEYFHELLSRSIFQQSTSNFSKFVMHNLINDLARSISKDTSFVLEDKLGFPLPDFKRIRYSSYSPRRYEVKNHLEVFHGIKKLRTFLPLEKVDFINYASQTILSDLLPKLKKLRVLSFTNYNIKELPDSIGGLAHLRYLDLSRTAISSLPKSMGSLYNLQVLNLSGCSRLENLPSNIGNLIKLRYLDISRSYQIREMPLGIGKLKCLQTLSHFIVGKDARSTSLNELKDLKFLSGNLVILSMEKIVDSQDIKEFILNEKKDLKELKLYWGYNFCPLRDMKLEESVLEILRPHKNLEELTINNYGGRKFPLWLGDPSFSKMVILQLDGCENCVSLPSIVQLCLLKTLIITNMKNLKMIGREIYGDDCTKSFQSLETLSFEKLPEWEQWDPIEENEHVQKFPHLQNLSISKCPKFSGRLPSNLPLLEKLEIDECEQLLVSFSNLSMLRLLKINRCKGMVCSNSIDSKSLNFEICEGLKFPVFKNWPRQGFHKLKSLTTARCDVLEHLWSNEICLEKPPQGSNGLSSLQKLCLDGLPNLVSVPDGFFSILSRFEIRHCNALLSLHEGLKHNNPCLEYLEVDDCSSLTCIVRGHLPSSLKKLSIRDCENLLCIWDDRKDTASTSSATSTSLLNHLDISNCPSLTCLSSTHWPLPTTIISLSINSCSNLKRLSSRGQLSKALKSLQILYYPMLESIAERFVNNTSLERIEIAYCEKLISLPEGLHNLSSLCHISLNGCSSLLVFPEGGLPNTSNLRLSIQNCEKLKALPNRMHTLNSLRHLGIGKCPSIVSYRKEGLPCSITSLSVGDLDFYKHLKEWGFHNLTLFNASVFMKTQMQCVSHMRTWEWYCHPL